MDSYDFGSLQRAEIHYVEIGREIERMEDVTEQIAGLSSAILYLASLIEYNCSFDSSLIQKNIVVPLSGLTHGINVQLSRYRNLAIEAGSDIEKLDNMINNLVENSVTSNYNSVLNDSYSNDIVLDNNNKYYYSDENLSYASGYEGECTWYSYGRANELLAENGSENNWKYAGNANTWYDNKGDFEGSTNVRDAKVNSIVVWDGGKCGHVAVVEEVNVVQDGKLGIIISEANYPEGSSPRYVFLSYEEVESRGSQYFVGYIYLD